MPRIKIPAIPANELVPRMRLAQKLRATTLGNKPVNANNKTGELYEIGVGLQLQRYGWLREGFQIGRDTLSSGEPHQKLYVGNREVDGLFRQGLDRRWLIGQAKSGPKQGGSQIREAIEFTLVDQMEAARENRNRQLAGLVYAQPEELDAVQRKVGDNVIKLLREQDFSRETGCTHEHLVYALDSNCKRAGVSVKEAEKTLDEYVQRYQDFPVREYRRQMFSDVDKLLGVSLKAINPPRISQEQLTSVLGQEMRVLDRDAQ